MRNGESISIDNMDVNHLRNVLKMIVNNSNKQLTGCKTCKQNENLLYTSFRTWTMY